MLPTHGRYLLTNALFNDDERLRLLLEAWAELPESVKDAIIALVLRSRP
jgi:hypothetical protein